MKKILVFLLLFTACTGRSFAQQEQVDTNNLASIQKGIQDNQALYIADSIKVGSLEAAIKGNEAILPDSPAIQKKLDEDKKSIESLTADMNMARANVQKYTAMAGRHVGGSGYRGASHPGLGLGLCVMVAVLILVVIIWLFMSHAWIKTALAENVHDKETKENPQYSALAIMQLMANAGAGTRAADDQTLKDAVQKAKDANDAYAATPDDATKKEARDKALADLASMLNPASVSPVVMNSLIQLFPPTIEVSMKEGNVPVSRPSASRLLAFFSGMLLLFVALISTCFYVYYYLLTGDAPDLGKLTGVLIALGIGLAPYAVNKVANASSDKDKTI